MRKTIAVKYIFYSKKKNFQPERGGHNHKPKYSN